MTKPAENKSEAIFSFANVCILYENFPKRLTLIGKFGSRSFLLGKLKRRVLYDRHRNGKHNRDRDHDVTFLPNSSDCDHDRGGALTVTMTVTVWQQLFMMSSLFMLRSSP